MKAAIGGAFGRASRPLAGYYAIAVAVPVLNGATLDSMFLEHVAFVLAVPVVIVMAAGCAWRLTLSVGGWHREDANARAAGPGGRGGAPNPGDPLPSTASGCRP